jgi:endonuclease/exonuclease/phosphatase family metal-dependent hydrolase
MVRKIVVTVSLCLTAALTPSVAQGPASAALAVDDSVATLRVGSFNIRNATLPLIPGIAAWSKRRNVVIRQILAQKLDMVGIQEASFRPNSTVKYPSGARTQYADLIRGLNAAGGNYKLTSKAAYNCENAKSPYKCDYVDRGASGGERILYNADRLELVSRGAKTYSPLAASGSERSLVWAALRLKATGQEILFTTTHLSKTGPDRLTQWMEMIPMIEAVKGSRPVIATGDFNVRKTDSISAKTYPAMKAAGYGDVLNQSYGENPVQHPRALESVNGWLRSFNGGVRDVAAYGYEDKRYLTGNIIDHVFADNDLVVRKWEVVVNYDPRTLETIGRLPSDHNLVVATLEMR